MSTGTGMGIGMETGTSKEMETSLPVPPLASFTDRSHIDVYRHSHNHNRKHNHAHGVQFYEDDGYLIEDLSRFFGAALVADATGVVIATEAHRARLDERLSARGVDLGIVRAQGRYISLDADETLATFMVQGVPDARRFAEVVGGVIARAAAASEGEQSRVTAFGEMVTLLWQRGETEAAIQLEQLWNNLAETHAFELRCGYPMSLFLQSGDGESLDRICAEHGHVIPAESYTALSDDDERLRAIALLQQQARALRHEIAERTSAQRTLQRREAELSDFLENALEGVQQVDAGQKVVWANKALLQLLGYTAEEYVGQPLGGFHVDQEVFTEFWRRLIQGEELYDYPADLRCKDGSVRHVLIHSNALWHEGQFVHTRCFIRDITEQTRMEQALRERNQELRQAIAARDEFLSVAAHELKTPITSLRAFAQLLLRNTRHKRRIAPERLESALEAIELQTGKLSHLVTRLLETTQIGAGKLRIEPVTTDLVALIGAAIAQRQGSGRPVHAIVFEGPERLEALVDPAGFEQVVGNLLDNAIKFSPEGGVVTVELARDDDGSVRLAVSDQGVGIPPAERERIFERYHQAHNQRHLSGMGLGLYITREIAGLHGGIVRLEERDHRGSRFVVVLPPSAGAQAGATA